MPSNFSDVQPASSLPAISAALEQLCERIAECRKLPIEVIEELLKLEAIARELRMFTTKG
jgi:hypothetical protein